MANVKISELTPAPSPLSGTEELPLVQSSVTYKVTAQDIANLAGNIALPNFATAQIINVLYSPTTYDLTVLFPSINFSNVAVHLDMQFLILGSSSVSSVYYNVVRDAFSSFFSYGSAYTQYDSGSPLFPSFIFGGTNSNPTIEFYISGGNSISVSFTITTL